MAKQSRKVMVGKVAQLRKITNGKEFKLSELPPFIYQQLGYFRKGSLETFVSRLCATGPEKDRAQLERIGPGRYCWVDSSEQKVANKSVYTLAELAQNLSEDEEVALQILSEKLNEANGDFRFNSKTLPLSEDEFEEFVGKLEAVSAIVNLGPNEHAGFVWRTISESIKELSELVRKRPIILALNSKRRKCEAQGKHLQSMREELSNINAKVEMLTQQSQILLIEIAEAEKCLKKEEKQLAELQKVSDERLAKARETLAELGISAEDLELLAVPGRSS